MQSHNQDNNQDVITKLKSTMNFHWKIQTSNRNFAVCCAYVDARQVADRLDQVFGLDWSCSYEKVGNSLFCTIKVNIDGKEISRSDCGTPSAYDKEKGEASDAFKRAAVKFGIGRFLYDLPIQKVRTVERNGKFFPCDDTGKTLYGDQLTAFINSRNNGQNKAHTAVLSDSNGNGDNGNGTKAKSHYKPYFRLLDSLKTALGDDQYYLILDRHGYQKRTEFENNNKANLVICDLKKSLANRN